MALKPGERVVVVGCGPVGMVLTLALYRRGIPVTLIERNDGPIDDQRAAAIQPSTRSGVGESPCSRRRRVYLVGIRTVSPPPTWRNTYRAPPAPAGHY